MTPTSHFLFFVLFQDFFPFQLCFWPLKKLLHLQECMKKSYMQNCFLGLYFNWFFFFSLVKNMSITHFMATTVWGNCSLLWRLYCFLLGVGIGVVFLILTDQLPQVVPMLLLNSSPHFEQTYQNVLCGSSSQSVSSILSFFSGKSFPESQTIFC